MSRRGHSTSVGKFAKIHHDRRASDIRILGELLRQQQSRILHPRRIETGHDETLPAQLDR